MRQGILITSYKNFGHLSEIIDFFDDNFDFYIHIDRKSTPSAKAIDRIRANKKVRFLSNTFKVNWGGVNHLKAILLLAEQAVENKQLAYIHVISGQDFPIRSTAYFTRFLTEGQGRDYLQYVTLPTPQWTNGGMSRLMYYNFYDVFDAIKYKRWIEKMVSLQAALKIKRPLSKEIGQLYGGATWWSLTRETLQYVVDYTHQNKYFINRLKHTFCAEEIYVQTVVMNSRYADNVINENLRYVDWSLKNGSYPAVLDDSDFDQINSSTKLFARKFDSPVSDGLKRMLSAIRK